jgi:hypothetical protein
VLRVSGRILGSGAAGGGKDFPDAVEEESSPMEQSTVFVEEPSPVPEPQPVEEATAIPDTGESRAKAKYLIPAIVLVLLAGAAVAAWYLGLVSQDEPQSGSEPQVPAGVPRVAATSKPVPEEPVSLAGRALAQAFLNRDPRPEAQAMLAQAGDWQQAGDCEAAMIVYANAARVDAEAALYLAQRYDPERFLEDSCVGGPDAATAAYWYERPAREGNPVARRRLGQILTRQYASGPLFEQGLGWLEKAAAAGDKEAKAALAQLGSPASAD